MRFDLITLVSVVTSAAIHMAMFSSHPVLSLALATSIMSIFHAVRFVRSGTIAGHNLVGLCAFTGFAWMMIFVGATMLCHFCYYSATGWPRDEQYIDMPMAVVFVTLIYGGGSAVAGSIVGAIAAVILELDAGSKGLLENGQPSVTTERLRKR